jgi:PPP family 3-phenylpropionic acid transporter
MFPLASLLFLLTTPIAQGFDEEAASATPARASARRVLGDGRLRAVLAASFVLGLGMAMTATFAGVYLDQVGGGQTLVGLVSGVTAISELPIMQRSERIIRRLGGPPTLLLAYALLGCAYCGLAWITNPVALLGVAVFQGLGFGLFLPTTVRLVAGWAPGEWATTAQSGLNAAVWGLAPLIAGPLGGLIYDGAGPQAVFLTCAGLAMGAGLVLIGAQLRGVFAAPPVEEGGP